MDGLPRARKVLVASGVGELSLVARHLTLPAACAPIPCSRAWHLVLAEFEVLCRFARLDDSLR